MSKVNDKEDGVKQAVMAEANIKDQSVIGGPSSDPVTNFNLSEKDSTGSSKSPDPEVGKKSVKVFESVESSAQKSVKEFDGFLNQENGELFNFDDDEDDWNPKTWDRWKMENELEDSLWKNDVDRFKTAVDDTKENKFDFDHPFNYPKDLILHRALKHHGYPFAKVLLEACASPDKKDQYGNSALHIAAMEAKENLIRLLLYNGANLCAVNNDGLTAFHILLMLLMNKDKQDIFDEDKTYTNKEMDERQETITRCIYKIACNDCNIYNDSFKIVPELTGEQSHLIKKYNILFDPLQTLSPLQIICSFETWNGKQISAEVHHNLYQTVDIMISKEGVDPNATGAKLGRAVTELSSTPPAVLAASRGLYTIVELLKNKN